VIVVVPVPKLLANPLTSTEATAPDEDDQLIDDNTCVLPSSKFPTALNCSMVPNAIEELAELTEIEIRCAGTTVRTLLSLKDPTVALIVVEPTATVVASPFPSTVTTDGEDELQATPLFRSELVPSV